VDVAVDCSTRSKDLKAAAVSLKYLVGDLVHAVVQPPRIVAFVTSRSSRRHSDRRKKSPRLAPFMCLRALVQTIYCASSDRGSGSS
jgi:hypothetical protein